MELGVEFPEVIQSGAEQVPRGHLPPGGPARTGGQYLVDVLAQRCHERGIEIMLGRRVDRLLCDGGAVTGVAIADQEFAARAVVLATGGFAANHALIEKYLPTMAREGDRVFYTGPESSRGDVFALVEEVGASIVGFDRSPEALQPNTAPGSTEFDPYLPPWMMVVDPNGRRVLDEANVPYGGTASWVAASGGHLFALFDARSRADNGSPSLPTFRVEFGGEPMRGVVWVPEGIDRMVAAGGIVEAESLEQLADALGLPVQAVLGSVARYNESVAHGEDRDFLKDPRFLRAIEQPPFYGTELRPLIMTLTACGPQIDDTGAVLDQNQRAIGGLFAAGECTGGVIGPGYLGGGNTLASCTVFGRAAGRSAAAYALS
jgi:fumarate reductase flavoprotein subunit